MRDVRFRQALVVAFAIAVLSLTTVRIAAITHDWILIVYWTLGASAIGGCLLAFIVGRRYTHLPVAEGRVLCIVPAYNEPPESLARTVDALLAQTVEIDIVVIDDGSRRSRGAIAHAPQAEMAEAGQHRQARRAGARSCARSRGMSTSSCSRSTRTRSRFPMPASTCSGRCGTRMSRLRRA